MEELNDREKEITERIEAVGLKVIRMETREGIEKKLEQSEIDNLTKTMCEKMEEAEEAEDRKKTIDAELKKVIDEGYGTAQAMRKKIQDGFELIQDKCIVAIDPTKKLRVVYSITTGEEVAREVMTDKDLEGLQVQMPLEGTADAGKKAKKAAATTGGALEIGYEESTGTGAIEVEGTVISSEQGNTMVNTQDLVVVTQISLIENAKGAMYATTAERNKDTNDVMVLLAENPDVMADLKTALDTRGYVKITYQDNGMRNKLALKTELVKQPEAEPMSADDIPEGFELGEDTAPDGAESEDELDLPPTGTGDQLEDDMDPDHAED